MADGIDRRTDGMRIMELFEEIWANGANSDRLEFSTSKEVTVAPTFEDMHAN